MSATAARRVFSLLQIGTVPTDTLELLRWCMELCDAMGDCDPPPKSAGWLKAVVPMIAECRKQIEAHRERRHARLCLPMPNDRAGLTPDAALFMVVAALDYYKETVLEQPPHTLAMGTVPARSCFAGRSVCDLSPNEVDVCFGALQHNCKHLPLVESCAFLVALQRRSGRLLVEHARELRDLPDFDRRRIQWSCAVARIKTSVRTQGSAQAFPVQQAPQTTLEDMDRWLDLAQKNWVSPRFRESIMASFNLRSIRADETGVILALHELAQFRRAKCCIESARTSLYSLDYPLFMAIPIESRVGAVAALRDLIVLRLFGKALEARGYLFLRKHLVLDSAREDLQRGSNQTLRVQELFGGWGLLLEDGSVPYVGRLEEALVAWYDLRFESEDPLGLRKEAPEEWMCVEGIDEAVTENTGDVCDLLNT